MKLLFYLSKQLDTVQGVIEECAWGDMGFQWQTGADRGCAQWMTGITGRTGYVYMN